MIAILRRWLFRALYAVFGYVRAAPGDLALPSDDLVAAELERLGTGGASPKGLPKGPGAPATGVCVFFFAEGGSACAPGVTGGACDKWGDWWHAQGRDGWAQTEPQCPPRSKVYRP